MIADDHFGARAALRDLLTDYPALDVVGEAANGVEALTLAHALRPDVVVMDVVMPELDGIDATHRLRAELPSLVVFAVSTDPEGDRHPIRTAGAVDYFTKGADVMRLVDRLLRLAADGR